MASRHQLLAAILARADEQAGLKRSSGNCENIFHPSIMKGAKSREASGNSRGRNRRRV